jgi:hypothetical protein
MDAMNQTARMSAVFGEPSGAASVAGVKRAIADGVIKNSDSVSAVITGSSLKDTKAAIETAGTPMNTFALTNSGLTGPIYFRIYGYKSGAAAGTWRIDNLNIQGGVNGGGSLGTGWYVDSISVNDTTCCTLP